LAVLAIPTLLIAIDASVLLVALPHLTADLMPTGSQMLWIVDIYGFFVAGFLVSMGSLGDRIGPRTLLLIGAAAFAAASALAAFSGSPEMLIFARAVLGTAGATLMPSTLALITYMFRDPHQRTVAVGAWAGLFSSGLAIGPILSGILLERFWWGSVFLVAVPLMTILLATAPFLLPEFRKETSGNLDVSSVVLSLGAVLLTVWSLKSLSTYGFSPLRLLAPVVAFALGVLFIRRQKKLADPLLDLRLFQNRGFPSAIAVMMIGVFIVSGVFLLGTQQLQMVYELSPLQTGLWLLPLACAMIVSAMTATALVGRFRLGPVIGGAMLVSAIGCLLMLRADVESGVGPLIVALSVVFGGAGPVMALGTDMVVGSAQRDQAGSAAATSETAQELGISAGIAVFGSIASFIYREALREDIVGIVPADSLDAALDQLPAAVDVASRIPEQTAQHLLVAAYSAFSDGLHVVAVVSAVVAVVGSIVALINLRWAEPPKATATDAELSASTSD
jgi:proton antiporter efflux pump